MKIKILPTPEQIQGSKFVNKERFPKVWESVQRFNLARKKGCEIESLVLSINVIKYYLTILIEKYMLQNGVGDKKIANILNEDREVNDLMQYIKQKRLLSQEEIKIIDLFWDKRNDTVHNFINGNIEYEDISNANDQAFSISSLIFEKAFEIKMYPPEPVGNEFRQKIEIVPKKVNTIP
jgi:hypothetical protein